ncbi:MAG TPA: SulP family inorganic anion transporter [Vicinamibacterales bacterium]|nr:SulP family inorganic anion transporter [Vicinamibacterales bacterium]
MTGRFARVRPDLLAGATAAAVVIPKAMAYATIAQLPVQVGLYTACVPMAIYAMLGTSRPLSVSTTTTIAILSAAALGDVSLANGSVTLEANASLTVLVGVILIAASLLRLGFVADFISEPVLVGFKAGIAVVIVADQIPKILGVHIAHGSFVRNLVALAHALPETSFVTLVIGVVTIVLLVGLERFAPSVPAPLVAVACGIGATWLLHLDAYSVAIVGQIPQGLPPLTMPSWSLASEHWADALGIALMSFTETIAAGRAFASDDEPVPDANRELLATGVANAGGAFFGAMPSGGGTSQTAVNRGAGALTQLAALVTAGVSLAAMLLLAPVIALMPQAVLAATVITYSIGLIQPREFQSILRVRRTEFIWALTALAGVVLLGTLKGIIVAIAVSLLALAHQATNPQVYVLGRKRGTNVFRPLSVEHPDDETFPGLLLLRIEGRVFFVNAAYIAQRIKPLVDAAKPAVIAVDLSAVFDLEFTALKMLTEAVRRQRERGMSVWLVGLNPAVRSVIERSDLGEMLGREGLHFNVEVAVANYLRQAA